MRSPVYWHPFLYRLAMKVLYGRYFKIRYRTIADIIPMNAKVVEVCAGDGYLYKHYLRSKNIEYNGLDINSTFVKHAEKNKIQFSIHNILKEPVPSADYIIIQASLYQFIPHEHLIMRKLLDAANHFLIVAEPIRNLADSDNFFIRMFAKYSANPGAEHAVNRFTEDTLLTCFKEYSELMEVKKIENGREMLGVFKK